MDLDDNNDVHQLKFWNENVNLGLDGKDAQKPRTKITEIKLIYVSKSDYVCIFVIVTVMTYEMRFSILISEWDLIASGMHSDPNNNVTKFYQLLLNLSNCLNYTIKVSF